MGRIFFRSGGVGQSIRRVWSFFSIEVAFFGRIYGISDFWQSHLDTEVIWSCKQWILKHIMEFGKMRQIQSKGSVVVMAIPYDHPYINHTRWCPRSWRSLFITPISRIMLDISMIDEGYKLINQQTSPGGTTLQCFMKLHVAQSVATCPKLGSASNCMEFEWNWSSPVMETRAGGFNERCLISPVTTWIFPIFDFLVSVVSFHGTFFFWKLGRSSQAPSLHQLQGWQHLATSRWDAVSLLGFPNKGHPVINWNATAMSTGFHNWVKQFFINLAGGNSRSPDFGNAWNIWEHWSRTFPSSQGLPLVKGWNRGWFRTFLLWFAQGGH